MYSHVAEHLDATERTGSSMTRGIALSELRKLGLGDFVYVLSRLPLPTHPIISGLLPAMASDEICKKWTGNVGTVVMEQAVDFVRSCAERYAMLTGQPLAEKRILDFGCGYGRFLRCFLFYSEKVYGVDAWSASIDACRECGISDSVYKSEEVPDELGVPGAFDFVSAFSVFTHLSEAAAVKSLAALRRSTNPGGILALTIRPVEFWRFASTGSLVSRADEALQCTENHQVAGFAFLPHHGQEHYGDTSLTVDWLRDAAVDWEIAGVDRSQRDQLQRYVFLKAI